MDYNIKSGVRSTVYTGLTALALAGCGGGSTDSNPPKVNNAPTCEISISQTPENGYFPLNVNVQASCSDADGDSLEVILRRDGEQIATGNNQNYQETIIQNRTYSIEASDGEDTGSASQQVTGLYDQIANWSDRENGQGFIDSIDLQPNESGDYIGSSNISRLVDKVESLYPSYSLNGEKISFTSQNEDSPPQYAIFEADSSTGENIQDISSHLPNVDSVVQPDTCEDGEWVASYSLNGTEAGIGIGNGDTFTPIYTETSGSPIGSPPSFPKWSPDCSQVAFEKWDNNNWEVYLVNRDGSGLANLSNHSSDDIMPVFLSNSEIIFPSKRENTEGEFDLWITNTDGSNQERLTNGSGDEVDPTVSPDGRYIGFSHLPRDGSLYQIYLVKPEEGLDISNWVQLTNQGNNRYPAFRPRQE